MITTVTKIFRFEACHYLPYYDGNCHHLHGHSYKLEVTFEGDISTDKNDPKCGMIIDFKDIKKIVNDLIIKRLDHSLLNDFFDNPTAELMVQSIAESLATVFNKNVEVTRVRLWETNDSYAEVLL